MDAATVSRGRRWATCQMPVVLVRRGARLGIVLAMLGARGAPVAAQEVAVAPAPASRTVAATAADPIRDMQVEAERTGVATWGH